MEIRIQNVTFSKILKDGTSLIRHAHIITYVDIKKAQTGFTLTDDIELDPNEIIAIYRKRWEIEQLFKQMILAFPYVLCYDITCCPGCL